MPVGKILAEAFATNEFFSPAIGNGNKILTKKAQTLEIFEMSESVNLAKKISYTESSTIYDYEWVQGTDLYVSLVKDHPIVLRSCKNAKIMKKFSIYNHLCEIKSPYCACTHANSLYTCLGNTLHEFDLESNSCSQYSIQDIFRPRSVTNSISYYQGLIFAGSYNSKVHIIDKSSGHVVSVLEGQQGGVIQCKVNDVELYVGGRKDNFILVWDLRNLRDPVLKNKIFREHQSNQKILFDVSDDKKVVAGNGDGSFVIYNALGEIEEKILGHFDAVNSAQFFGSNILTSSGQRHYEEDTPLSLIRIWQYK